MRKWVLFTLLFAALSMSLMGITLNLQVVNGGSHTLVNVDTVISNGGMRWEYNGPMTYAGPHPSGVGSLFVKNFPNIVTWTNIFARVKGERDWGGMPLYATSVSQLWNYPNSNLVPIEFKLPQQIVDPPNPK